MDRPTQFLLFRIAVVVAAVALMAISLPIEAMRFTPGSNETSWPGYQFLICGWMGPCNATPTYGWFGNPLWLLGLVLVGFGRRAGIAAAGTVLLLLGLLVALESLRLPGIGLAPNEGGVVTHHVEAFGVGWFLWLGSFVAGAIGGTAVTLIAARIARPATAPPGPRGA